MKADFPSDAAYASAAWFLMCEEKVIRAFAKVESGTEGAFLDTGEPVILFERHVFSRLTHRVYDEVAPAISNPIQGGYGKYSEQHSRLRLAASLNHDAAMMSASWGLFQIMGENCKLAGYSDLQRFINAMYRSADDHMRAFVMFIRSNSNLVDALRTKDWPKAALYYNGTGFRKNKYDEKLKTEYEAQ